MSVISPIEVPIERLNKARGIKFGLVMPFILGYCQEKLRENMRE
jgi:hypothetical protein